MEKQLDIQKYLRETGLDYILSDAFQELLQIKPSNEILFLSQYLEKVALLYAKAVNKSRLDKEVQITVESSSVKDNQSEDLMMQNQIENQKFTRFTSEDLKRPFYKDDKLTVTISKRMKLTESKKFQKNLTTKNNRLGKFENAKELAIENMAIPEVSQDNEEDRSNSEYEPTTFEPMSKPVNLPMYQTKAKYSGFESYNTTQAHTLQIANQRRTLEGLKDNYKFVFEGTKTVGVALKDVADNFGQDYYDYDALEILDQRIIENQTIIQSTELEPAERQNLSVDVSEYMRTYSQLYSQIIGVSELARGGESIVYRIDHVGKDEVVIKKSLAHQINQKMQSHNDYNRQLCLQGIMSESQTLKLLQSEKYVCTIKEEIIQVDSKQGLILDYLVVQEKARFTLQDLLVIWNDPEEAGAYVEYYSPEQLAYYFLQMTQVLAYLHQRNVYYGDLKPQNILVFKNQLVKVGDFGTAIQLDSLEDTKDEAKYEIVGLTKAYQPESFIEDFYRKRKQTRQQLIASDIFSLIRTFQECLDATQNLNSEFSPERQAILQKAYDTLVENQNLDLVIHQIQMAFILDEQKLLNLINQMKAESKQDSIQHIVYLSKYRSFLQTRLSPLISDFHQQMKVQKNIEGGNVLPGLDQLRESSFNKTTNIQFQDAELMRDSNFKEMILLAMYSLKGLVNSEGKSLPNTKRFFDNFNLYFTMQDNVTKDLQWLREHLQRKTPLEYLSKQLIYKRIKSDPKPYLQYFEFLSYRLFLDNGSVAKEFSLVDVLRKDDLSQLKEKICSMFITSILETSNSLENQQADDEEAYTAIDFYQLKENEMVRNAIRANQIQSFLLCGKLEEAKDLLSSIHIEDSFKSLQFHQENKYKVAYQYLNFLIKTKNYQKAIEQAQGWLDRYKNLNGDSDPITLEFYGYAGEAMMLNQDFDIGIRYLVKYSKINLQSFCKFLLLMEDFQREDIIKQNLPAEVAAKFLSIKQLNILFEQVFFGTFNEEEAIKIVFNLQKLIPSDNQQHNSSAYEDPEDNFQKYLSNDQSMQNLESEKTGQVQAITNTLSVYTIFMRFLKSLEVQSDGEQILIFNQEKKKMKITEEQEKVNSYARIQKIKSILGPLHNQIKEKKSQNFDLLDLELPELDTDLKLSKKLRSIIAIEPPVIIMPKKPEVEQQSKFQPFQCKDGTTYIGEMRENLREGQGKLFYLNGDVYEGEWKNDKKNGFGKFFYSKGDFYEGQWIDDRKNGFGSLICENGTKYFGEWQDGLKHGKGIEIQQDGTKFEGNFTKGVKSEQGKLVHQDGGIYEGEFEGDSMSGKGKYRWPDGREYIGQFANNKCNGQGSMKWPDGRRYKGMFKDNLKEGFGIYHWHDGRIYSGWWKQDKQHGIGQFTNLQGVKLRGEWLAGKKQRWMDDQTYQKLLEEAKQQDQLPLEQSFMEEVAEEQTDEQIFKKEEEIAAERIKKLDYSDMQYQPVTLKDGSIYVGEWYEGKREGFGRLIKQDGTIYEGQFNKNKFSGRGMMYFANGNYYEGEYQNGKANGKGLFILSKRSVYQGEWKDGKQHGQGKEKWYDGAEYEGSFVEDKKNGFGKMSFANGCKFEGNFQMGLICGKGIYIWKDGKAYDGEWSNNKKNGFGILSWPDGRKYQGEHKDDKREGQGAFTWANGRIYSGGWLRGKQHGEGEFTNYSGNKRRGVWQNGKRIEWLDKQNEEIQ